jgi:uncharacterized protein (UPF0335 family)
VTDHRPDASSITDDQLDALHARAERAERGISAVMREVAEIARTSNETDLGDQARTTAMRIHTAMNVGMAKTARTATEETPR